MFKKLLKKSSFARNVIMITGGTVFAQGLNILFSPIITRIFTPDEYGKLTVYVAILGMINLLGALSYDSAIPIAEDDEKAFNILILCLAILLLVTSILFLVIITIGDKLLLLLNSEQLIEYKLFIPIGFFLTGLYTVILQWSFRKKDYKSITITKYSQSIVGNVSKIGLGLLNGGSVGLIVGNVLSQSAGLLTLIKPNAAQFKDLLKKVNYLNIKRLSIRYIRFPLYLAPGLFILSFASQLPTILISSLYGGATVGLFGLARSITFLPMTIIGKSVQDVFYAEAASIGKSNPLKIKKLSSSLLKKMIVLGGIPMLTLVLFGPFLFSFVFGADWQIAGIYSRLLSIHVFCHFIFHPISTVYTIFEHQKKIFVLNVLRLILVLGIFGLALFYELDIYFTILIHSISMALVELLKYIIAQNIISEEIEKNPF